MEAIITLVKDFLLSTFGDVVKPIIAVLILFGGAFLKFLYKKFKIGRANRKTEERRQDNQNQVDQEAQDIAQDARESERRVDDFLGD